MNLLDALCGNYLARSIVELILNPCFQRDHNSLHKAIIERHEPLNPRPVWLIVIGAERHQLSLKEIHEAFQYHSGMEQFFRFCKQNLLLDRFQTPETEHREH